MSAVRTILLGAAVTFMIASRSLGGICDEGPPGRLCFKDLSGYHDCFVNRNTGRVEQRMKNCPSGTRCTCMGSPCAPSLPDPCGKFVLPPVLPDSYHTQYRQEMTVCSPMGCRKSTSYTFIVRDATNSRYRVIKSSPGNYHYFIVLPNGQKFLEYHIIPSKHTCTKKVVENIPAKIKIPTTVSYAGTGMVQGQKTNRWIWKTGGRHGGQSLVTKIWDTVKTSNGITMIVGYKETSTGSNQSKTSYDIRRYYYMFTPGVPPSKMFSLPYICTK